MLLHLRLLPLTAALCFTPPALAMDLLETMHLADQQDPSFAAVRATRGIAEQTPDIARAALLPQVVVTLGVSSNKLEQDQILLAQNFPTVGGNTTYNATEWNARFTQPLFNWSAFHQFEAAKSQRSRDQAKADQQSQDLMLRVAEAYFNVLRAEDNLTLAKERENTLNKKLEDTQARYDVGFVPQVDVLESVAQRDTATSQRLDAEDKLNSARSTLSASTGAQVGTLAHLRDNIPIAIPEPNDANAWGKLAVNNNPGLIASRYDIDASDANRVALRSGYMPTVNFYASYNDRNNTGTSSPAVTLNSGKTEVLGLEARWELYSGGRTRASERQAEYQTELARQNFRSSEQTIENQSRSLFMTVNTDASRLQANRRNLASNEMAYQVIESGYDVGTHNIVDLLTSESKLYTARLDLANVRYDYVIDSLRLHASAGMLNDEVITRINNWLTDAAPDSDKFTYNPKPQDLSK